MMATRTTRACDGVFVLDLGQGMAGAMPGMVLGDNGADVVKVEPPAGDWARNEPGFLMWNRNKRSVILDLDVEINRQHLLSLIHRADVLIESFRPGVAERLGLDWPVLHRENPGLIYCSIAGFGPATGYADVAGYEGLVSAAIGRMVGLDHLNGAVNGQDRDAPIFTAAPVASYGAAQLAIQGVLAALEGRRRTGRGDRVTTSLMQGAAAFLMRQELPRGPAATTSLVSAATHAGIELCFMTAQCKDGRYLQMCARQDVHFRDWLTALGLKDLLSEPPFARAPMGIERLEDVAELDRRIRQRMSTKTQDEWMKVFTTEYDVGCDPFLTPEEFLRHPQMVENDRVVEFDDPTVGLCRQMGPLVMFSDTPSSVIRPAPLLGEHTVEVLSQLDTDAGALQAIDSEAGRRPDSLASSEPTPVSLPLADVTVVELAYYIAGPLAGALLAELGARVIKVETLDGDPYRRTGLQSAKFLHGKESIAIDLKTPAGVAILHKLIEQADMFVHSFRPGVPERLKVDYATLSALNPSLIYLYAGSYGSKGPQSRRTAFHSTPNALSGAGIMQAGAGNPPVDDSFPDPGSALGATTALLLGLSARARTGKGQALETTMLASTGYIMSPWLVFYGGAPASPVADHGQHGFNALQRLYRCADGWVFISCHQEREWLSLLGALDRSDLLGDERFSDQERRSIHDVELTKILASALVRHGAGQWTERFRRQGAPAVEVSEVPEEVWLERQGLLVKADHPTFGDYWRPPPKVELESVANRLAPAAAIGEHSRPVLASLGYSEGEIAGLIDDGVVGVWPQSQRPPFDETLVPTDSVAAGESVQ